MANSHFVQVPTGNAPPPVPLGLDKPEVNFMKLGPDGKPYTLGSSKRVGSLPMRCYYMSFTCLTPSGLRYDGDMLLDTDGLLADKDIKQAKRIVLENVHNSTATEECVRFICIFEVERK